MVMAWVGVARAVWRVGELDGAEEVEGAGGLCGRYSHGGHDVSKFGDQKTLGQRACGFKMIETVALSCLPLLVDLVHDAHSSYSFIIRDPQVSSISDCDSAFPQNLCGAKAGKTDGMDSDAAASEFPPHVPYTEGGTVPTVYP